MGGLHVAFRKGTADERVLEHSFERDIFLAGVPEYQPGADDVVIDVGAHIGTFTLLVAPRVGRVYAIEAAEEAYDYLRVNCLLNDLDNVEPVHVALGGESGTTLLYHDSANWGHTIMRRSSGQAESVAVQTLGDFLDEHRIVRCTFLRMNCEGAEFPILLASPPERLEKIETMLVLYHCDLARGYAPEQLVEHLRSAGFVVEIRKRDGERGWLVATRPERSLS